MRAREDFLLPFLVQSELLILLLLWCLPEVEYALLLKCIVKNEFSIDRMSSTNIMHKPIDKMETITVPMTSELLASVGETSSVGAVFVSEANKRKEFTQKLFQMTYLICKNYHGICFPCSSPVQSYNAGFQVPSELQVRMVHGSPCSKIDDPAQVTLTFVLTDLDVELPSNPFHRAIAGH